MRIVSHYIAREFLKMTLVCLGTFVMIYLMVEVMEKLDDFNNAGVAPQQIFSYFIYILPAIIKQMIPVAILMGTQLTFGFFSKNNQLIAFKSSGISMIRLSSPIMLLAVGNQPVGLYPGRRPHPDDQCPGHGNLEYAGKKNGVPGGPDQ